MKNLTVILPVYETKIFSNYINYNLKILSSLKIKTLVISQKKIKFIENEHIKYIANKDLITAHKKLEYALRHTSTKYVYFLREDVLLHKYGFRKNFNKLTKNKSIISIQGIQFLAANKKYKLIFPHNPNNHNVETKLNKMTIQDKILNILNEGPECYWTFHTKKIVKKFFYLYFKKNYFKDPKIYDYYFIFFLLAYGNLCFSNIPINLKIKRAKPVKDVKYEDHQKNKNFYYTLNLLSKNFSKRKVGKKIAKTLLLESFQKRLFLPKPRDILLNHNTFEKIQHIIKKIIKKIIQKYYFKNLIVSQNDIYYISKLSSSNYSKITKNKIINMEFKSLLKKLIDPNIVV